MSAQVHSRERHQYDQSNWYKNIKIVLANSPVIHKYYEPKYSWEPTVATWVAILDRTIHANTFYIFVSPKWPWIRIISLKHSWQIGIKYDENNHYKSFLLFMTQNEYKNADEDDNSGIYDHSDEQKYPIKYTWWWALQF